jgi:hypothetical protein
MKHPQNLNVNSSLTIHIKEHHPHPPQQKKKKKKKARKLRYSDLKKNKGITNPI